VRQHGERGGGKQEGRRVGPVVIAVERITDGRVLGLLVESPVVGGDRMSLQGELPGREYVDEVVRDRPARRVDQPIALERGPDQERQVEPGKDDADPRELVRQAQVGSAPASQTDVRKYAHHAWVALRHCGRLNVRRKPQTVGNLTSATEV